VVAAKAVDAVKAEEEEEKDETGLQGRNAAKEENPEKDRLHLDVEDMAKAVRIAEIGLHAGAVKDVDVAAADVAVAGVEVAEDKTASSTSTTRPSLHWDRQPKRRRPARTIGHTEKVLNT
jgi:hypothetical protein